MVPGDHLSGAHAINEPEGARHGDATTDPASLLRYPYDPRVARHLEPAPGKIGKLDVQLHGLPFLKRARRDEADATRAHIARHALATGEGHSQVGKNTLFFTAGHKGLRGGA